MSARTARLRGLVLALLVALGKPGLAGAQAPADSSTAPWVQVEVVLFRQLDTTQAGDESWPEPIGLSYPEPIEILIEPGSQAHTAALAAREFDTVLAAEAGAADGVDTPAELPFLRLAASETLLAQARARLAGSPRHRLLAHLAWRHPLPPAGVPARVLLTGGAQTGAHHEVEGYITLSRARYLHADAKLWLNDFPASANDEAHPGVLLPDVPVPRLPETPPETVPMGDAPDAGSLALPAPAADDPVVAVPLRSMRTVMLDASRRLLPGEIHYFDHPLFGAVVTVRPWDPAAGAEQHTEALPALTPEGAEETPPPT